MQKVVVLSLLMALLCRTQVNQQVWFVIDPCLEIMLTSSLVMTVPSGGFGTCAGRLDRLGPADQEVFAVALELHEAGGRQLQGSYGVCHEILQVQFVRQTWSF